MSEYYVRKGNMRQKWQSLMNQAYQLMSIPSIVEGVLVLLVLGAVSIPV